MSCTAPECAGQPQRSARFTLARQTGGPAARVRRDGRVRSIARRRHRLRRGPGRGRRAGRAVAGAWPMPLDLQQGRLPIASGSPRLRHRLRTTSGRQTKADLWRSFPIGDILTSTQTKKPMLFESIGLTPRSEQMLIRSRRLGIDHQLRLAVSLMALAAALLLTLFDLPAQIDAKKALAMQTADLPANTPIGHQVANGQDTRKEKIRAKRE